MAKQYKLKSTGSNASFNIDYQDELNPQQCAAATAKSGPSLVIAGAGAGKTRTLIYRVAYLAKLKCLGSTGELNVGKTRVKLAVIH